MGLQYPLVCMRQDKLGMTMELTDTHGAWVLEQAGLAQAVTPIGAPKNWVWGLG